MELLKAKTKHLNEFIKLEKEFLTYRESLEIDSHYGMEKTKNLNRSYFEKVLRERLSKKDSFFYFVKEDEVFLGYVYGYIERLPLLFRLKKIGYLDGIFVSKSSRGKKVATFLKKEFFSWLRNNGIKLCQIHVAVQNIPTFKIYKKWGFEIDQYRLIKKV